MLPSSGLKSVATAPIAPASKDFLYLVLVSFSPNVIVLAPVSLTGEKDNASSLAINVIYSDTLSSIVDMFESPP